MKLSIPGPHFCLEDLSICDFDLNFRLQTGNDNGKKFVGLLVCRHGVAARGRHQLGFKNFRRCSVLG
jgi:hypothetical protein